MSKFVAVAWVRTGSTALRAMLHAHPDIRMLGDIFTEGTDMYVDEPPSTELLDRLFRENDGFMFLTHWKVEQLFACRNWDVRYVVLWRRNILQALISELTCRRCGVWWEGHVRSHMRRVATLGSFPVDEVRAKAEERRMQCEKVKDLLGSRKALWVFHEDLFSGPFEKRVEVMRRVFDFIGFPMGDHPGIVDHLRPERKHNSTATYRKIENVDEIEAALAAEYGSLFDGEG